MKYPYVSVIFNGFQPALIEASFTSKKTAQKAKSNNKIAGVILTKKQSEKQIKQWNEVNDILNPYQ